MQNDECCPPLCSGSLPPSLKSLRQRIPTIPAGSIVVSVTVKPFDVKGVDSCARRSRASFFVILGSEPRETLKTPINPGIPSDKF